MEYSIQEMEAPWEDTTRALLARMCTNVAAVLCITWGLMLVGRYLIHEEVAPRAAFHWSLCLVASGALLLGLLTATSLTTTVAFLERGI